MKIAAVVADFGKDTPTDCDTSINLRSDNLTMNLCIHKPGRRLQHDGNMITPGQTNDLHLFNVIKIEKLQSEEQN